jgi:3-oxoacyl-[acyl-carrier protein] reductase
MDGQSQSSPRVVVVTGASRGIGQTIAQEFASKGENLALISRHYTEVAEVAQELGRGNTLCCPYECDIKDAAQVRETFARIYQQLGRIDVLVNNAGANARKRLDTITMDDWHDELQTNLTGAFCCSVEAAKYMKMNGQGWIVNISSIKGKEATSSAGYGASKAGVIGLTRCLAKQLIKHNIYVNCVAPGFIDTGMTRLLSAEELQKYLTTIPIGRVGTVQEVANVVRFLTGADASYIVGATINVNGGYLMD